MLCFILYSPNILKFVLIFLLTLYFADIISETMLALYVLAYFNLVI